MQLSLIHAGLLLFLFSGALRAQQSAPAKTADSPAATKVSGRVTQADTGAPLRKVNVSLLQATLRGRGESFHATTDGAGRFEIADVPAGRYRLQASKPGYVTFTLGGRRGAPGGFNPFAPPGQDALEISESSPLTGLSLKMEPAAAITGQVTDEDGDPVSFAQVTVERLRFQPGGHKRLVAAGNTATDDLGNYRLHSLPPGKYFVSARRDVPGSIAYLPTYYPNSPGSDGATPIEVRAGTETRRTDISFRTGRTFTVTGTVVDGTTGRAPAGYFVGYGTGASVFGGGAQSRPDGGFTLRNVPPGRYTVFAQDTAGRGGRASRSVEVVAADVQVTLEIGRGAELHGRIRAEDGSEMESGRLRFDLVPLDQQSAFFGRAGNPGLGGGAFSIREIPEGEMMLLVTGLEERYYVKKILAGGVEVTDTGIRFAAGQVISDAEVLVAANSAALAGFVTGRDGQPALAATVLLIPADEQRRAALRYYRTAVTDHLGRFAVDNIIPGEYLVLAGEDLDDGAQFDPEFVSRNRTRAARLSAQPSGFHGLDLKLAGVP